MLQKFIDQFNKVFQPTANRRLQCGVWKSRMCRRISENDYEIFGAQWGAYAGN